MGEQVSSLWIEKTKLDNCKWVSSETPELADDHICLAIEKYALTANNITYAVVGDGFGYWNFFPTGEDDWGIVPVWGFAKVTASNHDDVKTGERVYGYFPMATHLVVNPGNVTDAGFVDSAEHRQGLAIIYNQYHRLGTETGAHEEERALYQPLFTTSFLIEVSLRKADWHGADNLLLTSASSKTALGLAAVSKKLSPEIRRIGLTSSANRDFVTATGLYDQILTYDELDKASKEDATISVDFAGNSKLLAGIHNHWGDNLKCSLLVGATHVDERSGAGELAGPKPILFFAPTAAEALIKEVGAVEFRARIDTEFAAFIVAVSDHLSIEGLSGREELRDAYLQMLGNKVAPSRGLICRFD